MNALLHTLVIGIGATALTDVWALLRKALFGTALPNYALVGRWFCHIPYGQFRHQAIANSACVRGESIIGWSAHYLVGVAFAALLIGIYGLQWLSEPTPGPALLFGMATVLVPFLLLQPGMGAGIAAARTPKPNKARLQSLLTHTVFGLGLYATAWLSQFVQAL